ncbi:MAG TPA: acetyl-CoA carboxylase biotin carboxyl carrier protein [Pyrinomonadaceae bacterium]|jgi:acetyl-CoA carboxylase biotin carboxyl carrier protein|nr:acetyl-CoA carboxylase biotin carboxyl carrier protein [Pyrinomonadaceae bacterium]
MSDPGSQKAEIEPQAEPEVEVATEPTRGRRRRSRSMGGETSINMDELRELIHLIRENDFTEFELAREGFRVRFRRGVDINDSILVRPMESREAAASDASAGENMVSAAAPVHPGAKAETEASEDQDLYIITSPIVGTFYRAASPNAEAFVKIGSTVEVDSVVCIIEAMKLMNEIQAETSGEVAKIYVENGQPVEYGQPLFGIKK